MIDKKGRLFGLVNVFDILIVLMIIAGAVFGMNFLNGKQETGATKNIYFTIEVKNVKEEYGENYTIGGDVRDAVNDTYYGVVHEVKMVPARFVNEDRAKGIYVASEVEGVYNAEITVLCQGTESETALSVSGTTVGVGKHMHIKGKGFAGEGYVLGVKAE